MHLPRWSLCLALLCLQACTQLQPRPSLPDEFATPPALGTWIDGLVEPFEASHPGQSAFRLLVEGTEAFAVRWHATKLAARSVDVQTYIWHSDLTGLLCAQSLLDAADRGARVRLLLDDMDARSRNDAVAALSAHPNIEVRLFNPFGSRHGKAGFIGEGLTSFGRINRRMHNKTWIVDNRIATVGGRNIGDEYFGASDDVNFVDLDFAMVGPVVRDASASFDKYWNSASSYPIEVLDKEGVTEAALATVRATLAGKLKDAANSRYAEALRNDQVVRAMLHGDWPMHWSGQYRFVSDDPAKVTMTKKEAQRTHVASALVPMIRDTKAQISIISPYFVPGEQLTQELTSMAESGTSVRILTNSLVANDVAAVHGGYSRYREALVEGGVQLWELKPLHGEKADASLFGSSGASLHTKAFAVDSKTLFVGSYNLDPRSTWLNCEQGVLVENAVLAAQLEGIFVRQTAGERAWSVTREADGLRWQDGQATFDSDPDAGWGRRFQAWLARVLHLDAQL